MVFLILVPLLFSQLNRKIILPKIQKKNIIIILYAIQLKNKNDMYLTGSTLSQLLYFPIKSNVITCPQTEVILKFTVSDLN